MRLLSICLILGAIASDGWAALPERQTQVDLNGVKPVEAPTDISYDDVKSVIPTNMKATSSSSDVGNRIADQTIRSMIRNLKKTDFAKTAAQVQDALAQDVSFGGDPAKGQVAHKVRIEYEAFQNRIKTTYKGYLNSSVLYHPNNNQVEVNVEEPLSKTTQLVLTHKSQLNQSMMYLKWDW